MRTSTDRYPRATNQSNNLHLSQYYIHTYYLIVPSHPGLLTHLHYSRIRFTIIGFFSDLSLHFGCGIFLFFLLFKLTAIYRDLKDRCQYIFCHYFVMGIIILFYFVLCCEKKISNKTFVLFL